MVRDMKKSILTVFIALIAMPALAVADSSSVASGKYVGGVRAEVQNIKTELGTKVGTSGSYTMSGSYTVSGSLIVPTQPLQ